MSKKTIFTVSCRTVGDHGVKRQLLEIDPSKNLIHNIGPVSGPFHYYLDDSKVVFPSFIDLHVHCREDRSGKLNYKEDYRSANLAAMNGGVGALFDMPNTPILASSTKEYMSKLRLSRALEVEVVPMAAITPDSSPVDGDVPYKVFLGPSVEGPFFYTYEHLNEKLREYQGCHISFHCEDPELLKKNKHHSLHHEARPKVCEIKAIEEALALIEKHNLRGVICHISTKEGVELCNRAKKRGVSVQVEASFHHLALSQDNYFEDHFLQVNPPLRSEENRRYLVECVKNGSVDFLATDHAPHLIYEKEKGISGIPHLDSYGAMCSWLIKQGVSFEMVYKLACKNPGEVFNQFSRKKFGQIKKGYQASFAVMDFSHPFILSNSMIQSKSGWSPFEGYSFDASIHYLQGRNFEQFNFD